MLKINGKIIILSLAVVLIPTRSVLAAAYFLPEYEDKGFNVFGDRDIDNPFYSTKQDCINQGYTQESCPIGSHLEDKCPLGLDINLYKNCISNAATCTSLGYVLSCPEGEEPNLSKYCNHDNLYIKCQCASCLGYDYTLAEASTLGYMPDGEACRSCENLKYKRQPAPCEGYNYDSTNCGVGECATLAGTTCISGNITKYKECTPCPPPVPTCNIPQVKVDNYWCGGVLRCWLSADTD